MQDMGNQLNPRNSVSALILSGGGARAAYQVGVLKAIKEWVPAPDKNPFPVILGTSAGAINAVGLASGAEHFGQAVDNLVQAWSQLDSQQIYRADWLGVWTQARRFIWQHLLGRGEKTAGMALLDNSPLTEFLQQHIDLQKIDQALASKALLAVGLTAFAYSASQSVTFYQSQQLANRWHRHRRRGQPEQLSYQHLLASTAIPLFFAPVPLVDDHYGDGALGQIAPISPALHLGANRVLVIGVGNPAEATSGLPLEPSLAQVSGQLLSSTFTDNLENDLERLMRVNQFSDLMATMELPESLVSVINTAAKPVEVCVIEPSKNLDTVAVAYRHCLPRAMRPFLKGTGISQPGGGGILSYLLFEAEYCQELIKLGYADAYQQQEKIRNFLRLCC